MSFPKKHRKPRDEFSIFNSQFSIPMKSVNKVILLGNVTEPLIAGCVAEMRIIGGVKFTDEGEVDDKIIGVLVNDKRVDHITSLDQLGEHFKTETKYYLENYKALKRPGTPNTGAVGKFLSTEQALEVVRESMERYEKDYKPKLAD